MAVKVGWACGKCPKCRKNICRRRPADLAVCECWMYCPLCGRKMDSYTSDFMPQLYAKNDMDVVMICGFHTPPYRSRQRPVEVILE